MFLHPMHPAAWVLDHLRADGWRVLDLLAFTRSSTLVLAQRNGAEPIVLKAGFGSNHVLAQLDDESRRAAYGFYWYQELTAVERALARDDFRHEVETALAVTGLAHVAPVLDHGRLDEFDWYTLPFYPQGSLRRLATAATFERDHAAITRCIALLADAADGLDNLHRAGVVHRDVYQENILLADDQAAVTDLGAARRIPEERGPTGRGPEVHWPPEYLGGYSVATPAADVFSLGVLAYRVVCGDIPRLHGEDALAAAPVDLREVLSTALAPDPSKRPGMSDLALALRRGAATLAGAT